MNEQSGSSVVESPARATEDESRHSRLAAAYIRDAVKRMGMYPFPIARRRTRTRASLLQSLAMDAARLTVEDLMALYLTANLWRRYPDR